MGSATRLGLRLAATAGFVAVVAGAPVLTLGICSVLWVILRLERP